MPVKISEELVLYDVEELARLFHVQPRAIRNLFKKGTIKGKKIARKWYTTEAELRAYFQEETSK